MTIRVVVADDSPFVCRLLTSYLQSSPGFQVVGSASDGAGAVETVKTLHPDVVTLDLEMPGPDGLETLECIMHECPTPVVLVTGVSRRAADVALQAIEIGAVDFILKYTPGVDMNPETLRRDIVAKVRAASQIHVVRSLGPRRVQRQENAIDAGQAETLPHLPGGVPSEWPFEGSGVPSEWPFEGSGVPSEWPFEGDGVPSEWPLEGDGVPSEWPFEGSGVPSEWPFEGSGVPSEWPFEGSGVPSEWPFEEGGVVVIGASTGGPVALRELLSNLPGDFATPIVIVQHMPASFTGVLAAQLDRQVPLKIREIEAGDRLEPGRALVAPGDYHLLLRSEMETELNQGPEIGGHRPCIDVTMQSAAQVYGARTKGILLTGMGDDGTLGLVSIRAKGGQTFAQDAASCAVNGMPRRAIERGVVDHVAPPARIAQMLR